jgi:hypothetical protein
MWVEPADTAKELMGELGTLSARNSRPIKDPNNLGRTTLNAICVEKGSYYFEAQHEHEPHTTIQTTVSR